MTVAPASRDGLAAIQAASAHSGDRTSARRGGDDGEARARAKDAKRVRARLWRELGRGVALGPGFERAGN